MHSRHNFVYLRRQPHLGPVNAAHNFEGVLRSWNVRESDEYVSRLQSGTDPRVDVELLTEDQINEERVYLGLRTNDGLGLDFAEEVIPHENIQLMMESGNIVIAKGKIHVPEDRWLLLDEIVMHLLPQSRDEDS